MMEVLKSRAIFLGAESKGVRWTKCNKKTLTDLRFRVTGLTEGHSYEFRVAAENAAGVGEP